jgi:hypothetical protein
LAKIAMADAAMSSQIKNSTDEFAVMGFIAFRASKGLPVYRECVNCGGAIKPSRAALQLSGSYCSQQRCCLQQETQGLSAPRIFAFAMIGSGRDDRVMWQWLILVCA